MLRWRLFCLTHTDFQVFCPHPFWPAAAQTPLELCDSAWTEHTVRQVPILFPTCTPYTFSRSRPHASSSLTFTDTIKQDCASQPLPAVSLHRPNALCLSPAVCSITTDVSVFCCSPPRRFRYVIPHMCRTGGCWSEDSCWVNEFIQVIIRILPCEVLHILNYPKAPTFSDVFLTGFL